MGTNYGQLTLEERCTISRLHEDGKSLRQIASTLGRAASSIAREIRRNSGTQVGYRPAYADARAMSRRWRGSRMERNALLRENVLGRLAQGYSPEQVAGRLAMEHGHAMISHESIYRFIDAQLRRPTIIPGGITCRAARANADGADAKEAARHGLSRNA